MSDYDIVCYFCGVHTSHVHKYLNLNKQLNKRCKTLTILHKGKWGISEEFLSKFNKEDLVNVVHCDYNEAFSLLRSLNYKLSVFTSNYRKGTIENGDVAIALSRGIKSIQISEMNIDFYYSGANYVSLISEKFEAKTSLSETLNVRNEQKLYSNCYLWDVIDECLPYQLTKNEFCKKYNLDPNKRILMWGPDSIQCQHENAQKAYRKATSYDNLLIKLHPNEIRRHKADRVNYQWSNDLYSDQKVAVLDPVDTHWAFKYLDCLMCYQSTLALEAPFYKKPVVYIGVNDPKNMLFDKNIAYKGNYPYVGIGCDVSELDEIIDGEKYLIKTEDYDLHMKNWLQYPDRKAVDVLCDQLINFIV